MVKDKNEVKQGSYCAAPFDDFGYHRVLVQDIDWERESAQVYYVDYGSERPVPLSSLRYLTREFADFLPHQAIMVSLPCKFC